MWICKRPVISFAFHVHSPYLCGVPLFSHGCMKNAIKYKFESRPDETTKPSHIIINHNFLRVSSVRARLISTASVSLAVFREFAEKELAYNAAREKWKAQQNWDVLLYAHYGALREMDFLLCLTMMCSRQTKKLLVALFFIIITPTPATARSKAQRQDIMWSN